MDKLVYDVSEVMTMLGLSRGTIYNLLNSGELESFKIGSKRRKISALALAEYIEKQQAANRAA